MPTFVDMDVAPWAQPADLLQYDRELAQHQDPPVDPEYALDWLGICTDLLYALSGRHITGPLSAITRPSGNCMAPQTCGCDFTSDVCFPMLRPIQSVQRVLVDGVEIDPNLYELTNDGKLRYLTNGPPNYEPNFWPRCQYLERPSSAVGTFEVDLTVGFPLPRIAKRSVCAYASQFIRRDLSLDHMLDVRTKNVNRAGFSIDVVSPEDLIDKEGRTGIYLVDSFLAAYNPKKLLSPSFVFSPDTQPDRFRPVLYPSQYDGRQPLTWPFMTGLYYY